MALIYEKAVAESNLEKELTDLIECVICLDTPTQSTHIYQCENGHLFCGECLEKVENCSVCRRPLTKNSRNLMIEKVLSILKSYRSKKESKLEEKSFPLNVNAKVFEPIKKVITEESKPEIKNEDWCQVVKKKRNVKVNHQDPTLAPNGNFNQISFAQKKNGTQETVRIRISNNFAGLILGNKNGGSVLNNIQSNSKAKIDCDNPVKGSDERILTIYGTPKQIQRAQFLLLKAEEGIIIADGKESKKMTISDNFAGYILGNRCAIMRGIESDSKANIFIIDSKHCSDTAESRDSERILVISGTPKQIQRAEFLIQNPSKIRNENETIQLEIPCRMAGAIIGNEGQRIRGMEASSNARVHINDQWQGTVKR